MSVLRGAGGPWSKVLEAQRAYVRSREGLTAREAHQLEVLRRLGRPSVSETVGLRGGVLLTRAVAGTTVADAMEDRPEETGALLDAALTALKDLHGPAGTQCLRGTAPIAERSIAGVFRRKFSGPRTAGYLAALGQGRGLPQARLAETIELVWAAVRRMLDLVPVTPPGRGTVIYGDLKPEHIYFDGPRMRFIDPAVQWAAGPEPDIAKLAGRSLLLAIGHRSPQAAHQIVAGVSSTLARRTPARAPRERLAWLREVIALWLMDTVNILSTCLTAPPELPLTCHQQALVDQALTVAGVVERVSALLVGSTSATRLLDAALAEVEHAAGGAR